MKPVILAVVIVVGVIGGAGLLFTQRNIISQVLNQRGTVANPFLACTAVTEDEARHLAEAVAKGLNALDPKPLAQALDLELIFGQAIHDLRMSEKERRGFIAGALGAAAKDNQIPSRWITALANKDRVRLLRVHQVDGHQRAQLRMLVGDGLNYLDLVIARTPAGQIRVVDYADMANGELLTRSIASVAIPAVAEMTGTPLERLIQGGSGSSFTNALGTLPDIRKLLESGKPKEALAKFNTLPEAYRTTRAGLMMNVQIAQMLGNTEYLAVLQEVDRRFPNDPSLSLLQIDAHWLSKRYAKAQRAIDRVDEGAGGDPYLDSLRANLHLESGDLAAAQAASVRACEREPGLVGNWWVRITVSLKAKQHAETARLLDEIRNRFGITFADLATIDEYKEFAATPEHAQWLARQPKKPLAPPPPAGAP